MVFFKVVTVIQTCYALQRVHIMSLILTLYLILEASYYVPQSFLNLFSMGGLQHRLQKCSHVGEIMATWRRHTCRLLVPAVEICCPTEAFTCCACARRARIDSMHSLNFPSSDDAILFYVSNCSAVCQNLQQNVLLP